MSKKSIVLIGILSLLLTAFFGAAAAADSPTVLRLWHLQAGPLGTALEELVEDFNSQHPGIEVRPEFMGDATALHQKIMAAIAANDPPELAQVAETYAANYIAEDVLLPIENFFDGPNGLSAEDRADLVPTALKIATYDLEGRDTVVVWPFNISLEVMFYNPEMLAEAGLAVPSTWDEFNDVVRSLHLDNERWGYAWTPDVVLFINLLRSHGGRLFNDDLSEAAFNDEIGLEVMNYLVELVDNGTMITNGFDWQFELINERAALATNTIVSKAYIEADLGDRFELGVAPIPAGSKRSAVVWGSAFGIFQVDDEKSRAAWEFLKWIGKTEQVARWSAVSGYLPTRYSAFEDPLIKEQMEVNAALRVGLETLEFAQPEPNFVAWPQIRSAISNAVNAVALGLMTPEQALRDAAQKTNRILLMAN
ncbi:MAG: ABC transporter substrate-binding protein [Firmicutes bacterium]|nr:ABC transporter substrate-binding protein [Bacillota bacterium]